MIKFEITKTDFSKVEFYEVEYFEKCNIIIEPYKKICSTYGCEINYGLFWKNSKNVFFEKKSMFTENYQTWFGYEITKNGQCICYDKIEGYTLGYSEGFLSVKKKKTRFCKKNVIEVTYSNDTTALQEALKEDFNILEKQYKEKTGDGSLS